MKNALKIIRPEDNLMKVLSRKELKKITGGNALIARRHCGPTAACDFFCDIWPGCHCSGDRCMVS